MEPVEKEFEKIVKRQKTLHKSTNDAVDKLLQHLTQTKMVVEKASDEQLAQQALAALDKKATDLSDEVQSQVKEYYSTLGKLSKSIEKKFTQNLELAARPEALEESHSSLKEAVGMHFLREGNFQLTDVFSRESAVELRPELRSQFKELYDILQSLRQHDLKAALLWARIHHQQLALRGSHLEFRLHQLQFISMLLNNNTNNNNNNAEGKKGVQQALSYARQEFAIFGDKYMKDIQRLMCSLLYCSPTSASSLLKPTPSKDHPLAHSPYADLVKPSLWSDVERQFSREFCALLGLSQDAPMMIAVNVGSTAIPAVLKVKSVMDERRKERPKVEMWTMADELPVELPLPKQNRYHSIFACPVSKEQTSETNPPMMLPCGHILCRETVIRISKSKTTGGSQVPAGQLNPAAKVKCPYCPNESTAGQACKVSF